MSSQFGHAFRISTWGESHGGGVGVVIDGCPPRARAERGGHPARPRSAPPGPERDRHAARGGGSVPAFSPASSKGSTLGTPICDRGDEQGRAARGVSRDGDAPSARRTPTTPTRRSTASATGRAADAPRRARRSAAWPRRPWRRRCSRASRPALEIVAYVKTIHELDRRGGSRDGDARAGRGEHRPLPRRGDGRATMIDFIKQVRSEGDTVGGVIECVDPRRAARARASRSSTSSRPTSPRR